VYLFADRAEAGRRLAESLGAFANEPGAVVLALPRGGVPVGYEVALRLGLTLDVYLVRKLGVPGREELAMGAIAGDGTCVIDRELVDSLRISEADIERAIRRETDELRRRELAYRDARPRVGLDGVSTILVDDGLATGATMRAAVLSLRVSHPAKIVVAVPVAAAQTCAMLESLVDAVVCLHSPEPFGAVGFYYHNFEQTTDEQVRELLARAGSGETGRRISA
jgi:predicted phosphoribosyltransferase